MSDQEIETGVVEVLEESDETRLVKVIQEDETLGGYEVKMVIQTADGTDIRETYDDIRLARIAYEVEERKGGGVTVPMGCVNEGKPAVAAYLYLKAFEEAHSTHPYEWVAEQMGVKKQVAKNYVSRFLNDD
jgi:hypothetical protein